MMKLEHWYSSNLGCWLVANATSGELLLHYPLGRKAGVAIEFQHEGQLLKVFPGSVNVNDKMGD